VDTRAKKGAHVVELGFRAANIAYGTTAVSDPKATVCMSDAAEAATCYVETDCAKTSYPKESACLPPGCSKTPPPGAQVK
jgi:hypothetical protein